jgi:heme exporter protein B
LKAFALFKKDWQSELRTRYALNSLAMFVLVTISVMLFSIGYESVSPFLTAGLFWVAVFFSAMSGLSRVFVSEEERGTTLALQITALPSTIFTGKLLFNLVLVFLMNTAITFLFLIFFPSFTIANWAMFGIAFVFGGGGIAISSTLIAAIISKANAKGTLYPVLSFPILLPLILTLLEITKSAMEGAPILEAWTEIASLISYDVIIITAGYLLFDFIWKD